MRLHQACIATVCFTLAASGAQAAGLVSPSAASTDMPVRAFFAGDPKFNTIDNVIDGNLTTGFITERSLGMMEFVFGTPADDADGFYLWNNAGSKLTDGESIGMMDITVLDSSDATLFAQAGVAVPEGVAGDPFVLAFPGLLNDVAKIQLSITANNGATGDLDGVALRDVAVNTVPEPSALVLLGLPLFGLISHRRRR